MGIRGKLLDYKRRLSDRHMYSIIIVLIAVVGIWGIVQYRNASQYRQKLDNQYNRSFYDMVGYVNNVEVLLAKSLITSTPGGTASIMQEAWRQANMAQANLGQLPISQHVLSNTTKFLTQVGDLAYSINNQNMDGKSLTNEQYDTVERLHGYALTLESSLGDLQNQLAVGRLKWGELAKKGAPIFSKTSTELPAQQFENIEKNFQEYPQLIYDGPFSDHLVSMEPRGLAGDEINPDQAKQKVIDFFGADKVKGVADDGRNDTDIIKTYSYKVSFNNAPEGQTALITVTQKGGHILWMLYNRPVKSADIDMDKAKTIGREFLESKGYAGMVDTYYLKEDNTAVVNYAYRQENVTVYPDLVKVKIALDNGEIIGIESKSYLSAHIKRDIPVPKITAEQARALVNTRVEILSTGLALIPTDYQTEIFTYEFKGRLNNNDFLVYINAETGKEENVLMIVNTPNGILTM